MANPDVVYLWVIKSKKPIGKDIWRKPAYLFYASRTSLKNPKFMTSLRWHRKFFAYKEDAEQYYFAKSRCGHDMSPYSVRRKKVFLDKKGCIDYWRNR